MLTLLLCGAAAYAQELGGSPASPHAAESDAVESDNAIVVSVTGYESSASDIAGSTGVETREQIAEHPEAASVSNTLEDIPGVYKNSDSPWGADVNIRGLSRGSVVMLIDGCRVNTATDINSQYGLILPDEIERVEVIKGPISPLYGTGSVGGVVNIITRKGTFAESPARSGSVKVSGLTNPFGGGLFGTALYESPEWYIYSSHGGRGFDSYYDGSGSRLKNSQYNDYEGTFKLGHKDNDENVTEAQVQFYEGVHIGIPGSGTAPLPPLADVTYPRTPRLLFNVRHSYSPKNSMLSESLLNLYYQSIGRRTIIDNFAPGSPVVEIDPGADHTTIGGTWQNVLKLDDHTLTAGLDTWQRRVHAWRERLLANGAKVQDKPLPDASLLSSGLYAEDQWKPLERLRLNFGGRGDLVHVHNDETAIFESSNRTEGGWNADIGAVIKLIDDLSVKFAGARGYRAATIEERFAFLNLTPTLTKFGDPNLDPEHNLLGETALLWEGERITASAGAYINRLSDLIGDVRVDETKIVSENINEARIHGFEGDFKVRLGHGLTAYSALATANGTNLTDHQYLPDIPPYNGYAGLRYENEEGFFADVRSRFAARQSKTPPNVAPVAGWNRLDLRAGYSFRDGQLGHSIIASFTNVLNQDYRDYLTHSRGFEFDEPGRAVGLSYALSF